MEIRVIDNFAEFLKLHDAWNELVQGNEVDHAFMKHEWFEALIKAHEAQNNLAIVTLWNEGQLAAVAPLQRTAFNFRGVKAQGLKFLSSEVSPRCNFIISDQTLLKPLISRIRSLPNWDILVTENQEEELMVTQNYLALLDSDKADYPYKIDEGRRSPYMILKGSYDDYWASLTTKKRNNVNRCFKKLEAEESFEILKITTVEEFEKAFPRMCEISQNSWKSKENTHLQTDSYEGKLFKLFTPIALKQGWVEIFMIRIGDRFVGFDYFLCHGNIYTLSRTDYDEEYKRYSPGSAMTVWSIKDFMARNKISEYDWEGDPARYKLEWSDLIRKHVTVTSGNNTLTGRMILFTKSVILPSWRKAVGLIGARHKN